jgi:transposase
MGEVIVVGCDPHKLSLTLAAVDGLGVELDVLSVANDAAGIADVLQWLGSLGAVTRIGIEGSAGHGQQLAVALVDAGHDVREVPARRTAQRRRERRRPKTDREDALAIARATAADPGLGPVRAIHGDPVLAELEAVNSWRDELVDRRKRLLNRAEGILSALPVELLDEIGRKGATIARARAAAAVTATTPTPAAAIRLRHLTEIVADHDELTARIKAVEVDLRRLVRTTGSTLRDETGIDWVLAARPLVEVGDPTRFRSESAFARWCGSAAVAVSSSEGGGSPTRHRLDLGGNRRINSVLHIASVVQGRVHHDARAFIARKRSQGKTAKEARRAHKRHLANRIIRRMWQDHADRTGRTLDAAA